MRLEKFFHSFMCLFLELMLRKECEHSRFVRLQQNRALLSTSFLALHVVAKFLAVAFKEPPTTITSTLRSDDSRKPSRRPRMCGRINCVKVARMSHRASVTSTQNVRLLKKMHVKSSNLRGYIDGIIPKGFRRWYILPRSMYHATKRAPPRFRKVKFS